jgi:molybdate transport system regulatory protein
MQTKQTVVRIHLWLETDDGVYFGQGRMQLLEQIHEKGSLSGAAQALGMSYRGAWGKIKTTEQILGFELLEKTGGNKSGFKLTPVAVMLMERYKRWLKEVEDKAVQLAAELFPCDPVAYRGGKDKALEMENGEEKRRTSSRDFEFGQ